VLRVAAWLVRFGHCILPQCCVVFDAAKGKAAKLSQHCRRWAARSAHTPSHANVRPEPTQALYTFDNSHCGPWVVEKMGVAEQTSFWRAQNRMKEVCHAHAHRYSECCRTLPIRGSPPRCAVEYPTEGGRKSSAVYCRVPY
jgi:hypothetical protein